MKITSTYKPLTHLWQRLTIVSISNITISIYCRAVYFHCPRPRVVLLTSKPLNYDLCHRFYSYLINLHGIKQIAITINSPYHLSMMTSITILITLRLELICLITVRAPLAEGALTTTCGIIIKDRSSMAGIIIRRRLTLSMIATQHPHPSTNCTPILIDVFPQTHHLNPHAYT